MKQTGIKSLCVLLLSYGFGICWSSQSDNKVIINTDGGADDASALIQVLEQPDVQVLAIACSFGNVDLRQSCDNTRRVLQLMGKADEIPVYAGCDKPLVVDVEYDGFYGWDGLGNHSQEFPLPNVAVKPQHAANVFIALAKMYPGEITLISLGPLTNLAVALKLDPTLPEKLKRVVIMGGSSHALGNVQPVAEFNIYEDPEAAHMVIAEFNCTMVIVPFELCVDVSPSWSWFNEWVSVNTSVAYFIQQTFEIVAQTSLETNEDFQDCDLVATTIFLYPEIVTGSTRNYAQVETCGDLTRGEFVVDYRPGTDNDTVNVEIYTTLDMELMLEKWEEVVLYGAEPPKEPSRKPAAFFGLF